VGQVQVVFPAGRSLSGGHGDHAAADHGGAEGAAGKVGISGAAIYDTVAKISLTMCAQSPPPDYECFTLCFPGIALFSGCTAYSPWRLSGNLTLFLIPAAVGKQLEISRLEKTLCQFGNHPSVLLTSPCVNWQESNHRVFNTQVRLVDLRPLRYTI